MKPSELCLDLAARRMAALGRKGNQLFATFTDAYFQGAVVEGNSSFFAPWQYTRDTCFHFGRPVG